jgi:hypothetical protein
MGYSRSPGRASKKRECSLKPEAFRTSRAQKVRTQSLENIGDEKSPHLAAFLIKEIIFFENANSWRGREDLANWNQMLSPVREKPQNLFPLKFMSPSKILEFREPYRICGVQSFGEKWAFRRKMSRLCRLEVRSSNQKSLLLLGLFANKLARRIHGFGQAGGGKGIRTHDTEGMILALPATILLRNDWLSSLIGALLCWPGYGRGAPRDRALPGGLLGGAEVVRRMASHEPQRIP